MRRRSLLAAPLAALAAASLPPPSMAADPIKIGFITTLSGPGGYLGEDARDAFLLAVKQGGGRAGRGARAGAGRG